MPPTAAPIRPPARLSPSPAASTPAPAPARLPSTAPWVVRLPGASAQPRLAVSRPSEARAATAGRRAEAIENIGKPPVRASPARCASVRTSERLPERTSPTGPLVKDLIGCDRPAREQRSPREAKPREPSRGSQAAGGTRARRGTKRRPTYSRLGLRRKAGPPSFASVPPSRGPGHLQGCGKPHSWRGSPKTGEGRVSSETLPSVPRSRSHPRPAGPRSHAQRMTRVLGAVLSGVDGIAVEVEVRISAQLPRIDVVGLPEAAVRESAARVRAAIGAAGHRFPDRRITVNLAPASVRQRGAGLDLPIAVGVLAAAGAVEGERLARLGLVGELALDGRLRPVRGALALALALRDAGCRRVVVPRANAGEAALTPGLAVLAADDL